MSSRNGGLLAMFFGGFGGCSAAVVLFNLLFGAWTFSYCLWVLAGKKAPLLADIIAGFFLAEITTPLAFCLWVLSIFGVHFAR